MPAVSQAGSHELGGDELDGASVKDWESTGRVLMAMGVDISGACDYSHIYRLITSRIKQV